MPRLPTLLAFGLCALTHLAAGLARAQGSLAPAQVRGDSSPDRFHPDLDASARAHPPERRGGSIVLHADALPQSLNYLIDNSSMCRRLQREVHAALVERDPWTLELRPSLCVSWLREDALVLRDGQRRYGALEEHAEHWLVRSSEAGAGEPFKAPRDSVERVIRGAAYTFELRDDVLWHDGQPFGADDVMFTWELTRNPAVACDSKRFQYARISSARKLGPRTLRFEFDETYYASLAVFEALTPLPRHLYDLRDPRHPEHDPQASDEALARHVNSHRCNREWIGLGPYRVTQFTNEFLELQRFERYYNAANAGWLERIRFRPIADDRAALAALLAGEIDFTPRLLSEDYFGPATRSDEFRERFYTGYFYTPIASYIGWNLRRAPFDDVRVRRALAHAFDWDELIASFYGGLARRVTAEWVDTGPDYDETLAPLAHDPALAAKLLAQSGWIDRDGDGRLDKDGKAFEFALLVQAGNKSGEALSQRLQESLRALGVSMSIESLDWPSLSRKVEQREFDAAALAWVMPVDSDPAQRWHSREVGTGTGNYASFADAQVDAWIDQVQSTLDRAERTRLMHAIQARVYELQPYLYGVSVAKRFAISKRIRNFRTSVLDPGYAVREWRLTE